MMWRFFVIISLIIVSLLWLYFLSVEVPGYIPSIGDKANEIAKFPSSLEDLKSLTSVLASIISDDIGFTYVLVLFTSAYLFKQTFAIPGSVFLNLLAGALFGLGLGFPMTCFLTACGATFCYSLAKFAGREAATRYFPKKVEKFSSMLEENASRLPYFLLSLRLLPISPNWAVNMCCGVLDVPITTFFLTVLIGLMPYNYICVTTGVILSKLTSINDIFTWTTMLQMSGVALMATLPAFLSKKQKKKPSPLPSKIE